MNIGQGSPVGVEFGYGLKFPAKYQKALYICDWTFGARYAIHTASRMSTYTASREEYLYRTPLPLTDFAAGLDGLSAVSRRRRQRDVQKIVRQNCQ